MTQAAHFFMSDGVCTFAMLSQANSCIDVYWLLAVVSVLMFLLSFLPAKNQPGAGGEVPMH
jgi:hypothetical protein